VKTMEALLEEKEKEIVQKGERLKVSFLSMLEGNKSCRSVSGCGKIMFILLSSFFFCCLCKGSARYSCTINQ